MQSAHDCWLQHEAKSLIFLVLFKQQTKSEVLLMFKASNNYQSPLKDESGIQLYYTSVSMKLPDHLFQGTNSPCFRRLFYHR